MTYFEWDPQTLSVSVDAMDREHRRLIAIMNELYELSEQGAPKAKVGATLQRLGAFTAEHFEHEESYMESVDYPGLRTHKHIHADLLKRFTEHVEEFGRTGTLTKAFFDFLRLWLRSHICGIDRKYGEHGKQLKSA